MKKRLLLFAFSALALSSCKEEDDIQQYEMDMLKGEWKTAKMEIVSGKDETNVITLAVPTGCDVNSTTEFRIDYYTAYNALSGVANSCTSNKTEGTYEYNTETKMLVIKYENESPRPYKVVYLNNTELKLVQMYDNIDYDGDFVIDKIYTTYKR